MLGEVGGLGCAVTDFLEFLQSFVGTHGSNARNQIPDVSRVVVDCFVHQLFSAITTTNTMIPLKKRYGLGGGDGAKKWTMSFHDGNQLILTPIKPSWKEHGR